MTSQYIIELLDKPRLWYIVLTEPHAELSTKRSLERKGFITYLPLTPIRRQWAGHVKQIHIPFITRCVFVHATNEEVQKIQKEYVVFPLEIVTKLYQNQ